MSEVPKALMVVDLRELSLMYELSRDASRDDTLHTSDQNTAEGLHKECAQLLGRKV